MSAPIEILICFKMRWWMRIYLKSLYLFCAVTGFIPNIEKIANFVVNHGMKMETK